MFSQVIAREMVCLGGELELGYLYIPPKWCLLLGQVPPENN
jgi:hypothetical protein